MSSRKRKDLRSSSNLNSRPSCKHHDDPDTEKKKERFEVLRTVVAKNMETEQQQNMETTRTTVFKGFGKHLHLVELLPPKDCGTEALGPQRLYK